MLRSMRERTQGIIAVAIIILISLTFILWGIQYYLRERAEVGTLAEVNKVKITDGQLRAAYQRVQQDMVEKIHNFNIDQKTQEQIKNQILQQLIQGEAIYQGAVKAGFSVSSEQINAILTHLPAFQVGGYFSFERFQQVLNGTFYSEAEFLKDLEQRYIVNQMRNGIILSSFGTPNEVNDLLALIKQTRDIGYVIIPSAHFRNSVKVSEQDISDYYQKHQQDFQSVEQISVSYIELSADDLKKKVKATIDEAKQYYSEHIDVYSHPKQWQLSRLFVPLPASADGKVVEATKVKIKTIISDAKNKSDFSNVDKMYGKPAWLTQNQIPQDFVPELQKLSEGQISEPLQTAGGIWVLKVLKVKEAETIPFAKVSAKVMKALAQDKLAKLFNQQSSKLGELTYTNSDNLNAAAKELGLNIKSTNLFTASGEKTGLLANPKLIKAAFSDTVLRQNYNSDLVEIGSDRVIVLRVKDHKPVQAKPLSEVAEIIKEKLVQEQSKQKAIEARDKILQDINSGITPAKAVVQYGLVWKNLNKVERNTTLVNPKLIAVAFEAPISKDKVNLAESTDLDLGDYAVFQVTKAYLGDAAKFDKKYSQMFANNLAVGYGMVDFDLYMQSLVKQTKIKKYDQKAAGDEEAP